MVLSFDRHRSGNIGRNCDRRRHCGQVSPRRIGTAERSPGAVEEVCCPDWLLQRPRSCRMALGHGAEVPFRLGSPATAAGSIAGASGYRSVARGCHLQARVITPVFGSGS